VCSCLTTSSGAASARRGTGPGGEALWLQRPLWLRCPTANGEEAAPRFRCFSGTLQVFCMSVAKVDRDLANVARVVHVCCKYMFLMFHLFFRCTLQVCLSRYCICFTYTLQVFYLDIAYVYNVFKCFIRMFQVFHLSSDVCYKCCIWMFQKQTPRGVRWGSDAAWGRVGRRRRMWSGGTPGTRRMSEH
jgi:hypothetical protein